MQGCASHWGCTSACAGKAVGWWNDFSNWPQAVIKGSGEVLGDYFLLFGFVL